MIKTGVISYHSIDLDMLDTLIGSSIDLTWEEAIQDKTPEEIEELSEHFEPDENIWIYGFKKDDNGLYEPDKTQPFSVIINSDNGGIIQVVHSQYIVTDAAYCSPCYPDQADLESLGEISGYILPVEYLDKDNFDCSRVKEV